jgi:hypothetical protein
MAAISQLRNRRKHRYTIYAVLVWAIIVGCLVTDLFVCPWTAVF